MYFQENPGCVLGYRGRDGIVVCGTIDAASLTVASALLHEATHRWGRVHHVFEDVEVDFDPNGAYGMQARYVQMWGDTYGGLYLTDSSRWSPCSRIVQVEGFAPCQF